MSTTSSSDCDCEDYCHYSAGLYEDYGNNLYRTQMFPTLGHPLIYYSQINPCFQPQPRRQRSRQGNPNCFVKAFRWYTQEHVPFNNSGQRTKPNMNEFASWLDTKYDEFIQCKPNDQNSYRLTLKQTSILTAEKNPPNSSCRLCSSNKTKFKRLKSSWRKRQRRPCSREGPPCECTTQSFQYILQPKEISQTNSCCPSLIHTPSTETQKTHKIVIKSQSCTSCSREQSRADTIDIMTTQEGIDKNKALCGENLDPPKTYHDMSCQCTIGEIEKINVGTQYDESFADTKNTSILKSYQSTSFKSLPSNESKFEKELKVSYSTKSGACQSCNDGKVTPSGSRSNSKTDLESTSKNYTKCQKVYSKLASNSVPKSTPPAAACCKQTICERARKFAQEVPTKIETETICGCFSVQPKAICHCPPQIQLKLITSDASTQYECQPSCCDIDKKCLNRVSQTVTSQKKCPSEQQKRFDPTVENGAQTSDHCIIFDVNAPYTNPLFMKIVCADKLN